MRSTVRSRSGTRRRTQRWRPRSPYAAAKAAGELLVRSYVITHGIDAVVTRGANTYGPYHHPEKLIPLFITNAIDDLPLPLYGDGLQRRDWLYVSDHAAAVDHVLRRGVAGETYNVVGGAERANREVVAMLLERLGKPWSLVRQVEDRPGHDRRYAMDGAKLAALGWRATTAFEDGLAATVDWFLANEAWWRATRSGDWDGWYERQYGRRLAYGPGSRRDRRARSRHRSGSPRRRRSRGLMRVAVTGAAGRLGRPSSSALADAPFTGPAGPLAWDRTAFDLDAAGWYRGVARSRSTRGGRPSAAWSDVDGCALDPALALRRNGEATGILAAACAEREIDLVAISTNEVFDGRSARRCGYCARRICRHRAIPTAHRSSTASIGREPAFERPAVREPRHRPDRLAVRDARPRLPEPDPGCGLEVAVAGGEPLRVVNDEWGTPTYTLICAEAIVELLAVRCHRRDPSRGQRPRRHASRLGAPRRGACRVAASRSSTSRCRLVSVRPRRPAGACSRRRRCRPVNHCAPGRTPWPTTRRRCCGRPAAPRRPGRHGPRRRDMPGIVVTFDPAPPTSLAPSTLPGVHFGRLASYGDVRGSFTELWRASNATAGQRSIRPGQPLHLAQGVLRGLHLHQRQLDYWVVVGGRAFVALVDARRTDQRCRRRSRTGRDA